MHAERWTTPLGSSTLQLLDGIPLGEAGNAPCLFSTRSGQKNQHLALYGTSGSGKGYFEKILKSRQYFQHDVGIWLVDSDEQREYASMIRTSGEALLSVINNVLDFSKMETDKLELESTPFDVASCVEDTFDIVALPAAAKDLDLVYDPASKVHFLRDSGRMVLDLVALRWRAWRGLYEADGRTN